MFPGPNVGRCLILLASCVPGALSFPPVVKAGVDHLELAAIMELLSEDTVTVDAERIVEVCSGPLETPEKFANKLVLAAALEKRGDALVALGKYHGAQEDYEKALQIHIKGGLRQHCVLLRSKQAKVLWKLGNEKQAVKDLKGLTESDGGFPYPHLILGLVSYSHKDLESALRCADRVVDILNKREGGEASLDPDGWLGLLASAYELRAEVFREKGLLEKALDSVGRSIQIEPLPGAEIKGRRYILRGRILRSLGKPHQAINNFLMAGKAGTDKLEVLWQLWQVNMAIGREASGFQNLKDMFQINPNDFRTLFATARVNLHLGWYAKGLRAAENAIRINPDEASTYSILGDCHFWLGEYSAALESYNIGLKREPENPSILLSKARLLAACPDPSFRDGKKALEIAERAAGDHRDEPGALLVLACAYAESGDFAKAIRVLREARSVETNAGKQKTLDGYLQSCQMKKPIRFEASTRSPEGERDRRGNDPR